MGLSLNFEKFENVFVRLATYGLQYNPLLQDT